MPVRWPIAVILGILLRFDVDRVAKLGQSYALTKSVDRVPRARALWGLDGALVGAGPGRSAPETSNDRPGTGQTL